MGGLRFVILQLFSIVSDFEQVSSEKAAVQPLAAALAFDKSINDESIHPQCHLLLPPRRLSRSELNLSKVFEPKPAKAGQEVDAARRRKFVGVK